MAPVMKTPGVYIVEKSAFPNSIGEVATSVPAFVGYTQTAEHDGHSLLNIPLRITSLTEFQQAFGVGPLAANVVRFALTKGKQSSAHERLPSLVARDAAPLLSRGATYTLTQSSGFYLLYFCLQQFFQNGGEHCYVVSVGGYDLSPGRHIEKDKLIAGIGALAYEQEPTMLVVPEAILLGEAECADVQREMLNHCGHVMKNRIAILDIREGYLARTVAPDCVTGFRNTLGNNFLSYSAAYYPWVNANVVQSQDVNCTHFEAGSCDVLIEAVKDDLHVQGLPAAKLAEMASVVDEIKLTKAEDSGAVARINRTLAVASPFFKSLLEEICRRLNMLPPSGSMAGLITMVDNTRGVWKAPANVSINGVISPCVNITSAEQEDLNVTPQGKSINAIRAFIGEGTLVWGARTLDGNSLDFRYLNVRRSLIMLEESIKLAAKAMVFEPNTANTWVTIKSMIVNFLTSIWKRGGLAGGVPEDAFSVHVGLGETMTPEDVAEGVLRVTVLVALARPAEFIEITFQQQMQKP